MKTESTSGLVYFGSWRQRNGFPAGEVHKKRGPSTEAIERQHYLYEMQGASQSSLTKILRGNTLPPAELPVDGIYLRKPRKNKSEFWQDS